MALLPAVVPGLIEKRAELVPARFARKVAALFGVPSDANPFRPMTWVCDFTAITVSEIARGAPLPVRGAAARLREQSHEGEWFEQDRAVLPAGGKTLPNEIVAATVNRFGPDTKAAIVLTATNVLLTPATESIAAALPLLRSAEGGELPTVQWIAAWAATAVEVYRSQPALVLAAIKARTIQRESLTPPRFPWADRIAGDPKARCEIGAVEPLAPDPLTRPSALDFIDGIAVGRLNAAGGLPPADSDTAPSAGGPSVGDRMAALLVRLLANMGSPDSVGYVWVSAREPGQLVAEAMVPSSGLVRELVEAWAHGPGELEHPDEFTDALGEEMAQPVRLPAPREIAALPVLARRAVVLAAMGVVRQMGLLAPSRWVCGPEFAALLDDVEGLLGTVSADDPVVLETRLRLAVQRASVQRHDGHAGDETVAALLRAADECLASGALDRGAVADVLVVTCIELFQLRDTAEDGPALTGALHRYWRAFADAVEVDLFSQDADHSSLSFQLHNYAAFLGGNRDSEADLRAALHLFTHSVIPGRTRLFNLHRDIRPLARSWYLAADTAAALAELLLANGSRAEARGWIERAFGWVSSVLADRRYAPEKLGPRLDDCLFALRAAPVLLLALEHDLAADRARVLQRTDELVQLVELWLKENTDGQVEKSRYYAKTAMLRNRVTAAKACS
ncbi:hypothetical protein [Lentzea flaviverrucosa]|uniref:Uncharacterized protein n=1 Tax=Lentzea flaviverrucosa TaxID=200379 RepID=A0A1H9CBX8_9PSEU|nr:hypothetical protein [Lentzea flaviverrucosa]RDI24501.1 hypothetical protein DFR72_10981 [Lentzea flaviverrucosa]SEP98507.1 hypothetical protein SAMN05216195_101736 [Lentzea flaviverrucosa]